MWFEKGYSDETRSFIYNTKAATLFDIIDKMMDESMDRLQTHVNDATRSDDICKANYYLGTLDFIKGFPKSLEIEIKAVLEEIR